MASAAVQHAVGGHGTLGQVIEPLAPKEGAKVGKHDVETELNYYQDPGDGSKPVPYYVGQPNTYERPTVAQKTVIHDITGEEEKYTLDSHGFQVTRHESKEKEFLDEERIKEVYYPEVEQLLKDV
ncbi:hypothetical protein V494_04174 [Pseudogymnoascus sp. VKM F-4513 (FW-928)]|nr:hypothetical protein V494_04174 [Pseudogymnoascus sp. VKM F-4513 (FW-928)]